MTTELWFGLQAYKQEWDLPISVCNTQTQSNEREIGESLDVMLQIIITTLSFLKQKEEVGWILQLLQVSLETKKKSDRDGVYLFPFIHGCIKENPEI